MTKLLQMAVRGALTICTAALFLLVPACRNPVPPDTLVYYNWWNYYQRGLERLEDGRFQAAREDFEKALGLQPGAKFGYDRDQWRVRTYGMHFLDQYFANRELGVALYELGETESAVHHLEKSLEQTPSGRAKHYLNEARARLVSSAAPAPLIHLQEPPLPVTSTRKFSLAGSVSAEAFVKEVRVQDKPRFIELAEKDYELEQTVFLSEGPNNITVEARDLLGRSTTETLSLYLDRQAPTLSILEAAPLPGGGFQVSARADDGYALYELRVNGTKLMRTTDRTMSITFKVDGPTIVEVDDRAGNTLKAALDPSDLAVLNQPVYADIAQAEGTVLAEGTDRLKPSLRLFCGKGPFTVYKEEFFLDGSSEDGGGLASLTVNGENLVAAGNPRQTLFARTLPLEPGTNLFTVSATDLAGNTTTREIAVIMTEPVYLDDAQRLSVGVAPLGGSEDNGYAFQARRQVEESILVEPVRFRLLERDEGWDFILQEQQLSVSDLADPRSALKIGRMLPAEMLLMGNLTPHGEGLTVYMRVVESGNGEVLFVEDVYSSQPSEDLAYQLSGLVLKIEQRFPLLEGHVLEADGSKVTLDFGSAQGARAGLQFLVVNGEDEIELREHEGIPVRLAIKRAAGDKSLATVIAGGGDGIREGDLVYAR